MKNKIFISAFFLLTIVFILGINSVVAETALCSPDIKLASQDPSPAVPNEYMKVVFEVTGIGDCDGFAIRLNQEYPFSLDLNSNNIQTIESNPYAAGYGDTWTIPYKIRIDKNALDGDYGLKLQYHEGSSQSFNFYTEKEFNVTITSSQTNFDAVIQEATSSQVSIAIANVGKYTANSVVVRIPQQDDFTVTGTDGQMVGNLDSGDYTIVGFSIASKRAAVAYQGQYQNASRGLRTVNGSSTSPPSSTSTPHVSQLKFDIYYTDNIGERRIVNMALPLNMGGAGNFSQGASTTGGVNFTRRAQTTSTSKWYSSWIFWVIIICVLIVIYILYKKNIFKKFFKKGSSYNYASAKIPDWIRNAKEKEKKK